MSGPPSPPASPEPARGAEKDAGREQDAGREEDRATAPVTPPVAAVVINYNAGDYVAACLRTLRTAGAAPRIVVDNASVDDAQRSARAADPELRWIDSGSNLGFGQGANLGVAGTDTPYVLICNPDLTVDAGAVRALAARLDAEPDLGVVGPEVLNQDGTIYPAARTFPNLVDAIGHGLIGLIAPTNRFTRRYRMLDWDHQNPARVDSVSGACFLARRTAWDAVGGFDAAYFMYLEDVDLCWRLGRAGWGVGYEPGASVVHIQGISAARHPYRMLLAHHRSLWRFATQTTTGTQRAALPVVAAGLVARFVAACAQHRIGTTKPAVPDGPADHQRASPAGPARPAPPGRVP